MLVHPKAECFHLQWATLIGPIQQTKKSNALHTFHNTNIQYLYDHVQELPFSSSLYNTKANF
jgi:hypothetical protein